MVDHEHKDDDDNVVTAVDGTPQVVSCLSILHCSSQMSEGSKERRRTIAGSSSSSSSTVIVGGAADGVMSGCFGDGRNNSWKTKALCPTTTTTTAISKRMEVPRELAEEFAIVWLMSFAPRRLGGNNSSRQQQQQQAKCE